MNIEKIYYCTNKNGFITKVLAVDFSNKSIKIIKKEDIIKLDLVGINEQIRTFEKMDFIEKENGKNE